MEEKLPGRTDVKQMADDDTTIWKSLLAVCFGSSWPSVLELRFFFSSQYSRWLLVELITRAAGSCTRLFSTTAFYSV